MRDSNETIDAILAKMKKRVIGEDGIRYMLSADEVLSFLNSIEVAIKRERALLDANVNRVRELEAMLDGAANTVLGCAIKQKKSAPGNAAAMLEALQKISHSIWSSIDPTCNDDCCKPKRELAKIADAALSAPARNCDVGTAEEQAKRFKSFCDIYDRCGSCPLDFTDDIVACPIEWAQMPFAPAKGGAE